MYYICRCAKFLTWLLSFIFKIPGTVLLKEGIIIFNIQMKKLRFTEVKQFSQDHPVRTPDNLSLEYPLFTITVLALSKEWDCPSSKLLNRPCNLLIGTHLCLVPFSSCVWLWTFKFLEGVLVPGICKAESQEVHTGMTGVILKVEISAQQLVITTVPKPFKHLTHEPAVTNPYLLSLCFASQSSN